MILKRLQVLRQELRVKKADAFLLINHEQSGQPATRYLSGFSGTESVLVVTPKKHFIVADGRYFSQAEMEAEHFKLIKRQNLTLATMLKELFEKERVRLVLIDGSHTAYSFVEAIRAASRRLVFKNDPELLHRLRIVKDAGELRNLQKAADISIVAFKKLLSMVKPGVTELWLASRLELLMKEGGAAKAAFESIVASGKNGARPHAKPTAKKIKKGELITFDFGASYNGYMSDITRTVALGTITPKLRAIYETVRESQELGCSAARAGVTGRELDMICREYIHDQDYSAHFLHSTGHGLGMQVHELPIVSSGSSKPLPVNAVITVEPGIYVEGLGGVRIEDALVIKKDGNINLHQKMTKKLITL